MNPSYPPQFLVVAAPAMERARELTDAMHQSGWQVALATTPEQIIPPLTAALVILSPATQDDPAIRAIMGIPGLRRIPVFAEPMVLPYGDWASAPVLMAATPAESVRAVMVAIFGPPPQFAAAASPVLAPKRQSQLPAILGISGLILSVIVVVVGILVVRLQTGGHLFGVSPTATPQPPYMSDTPGLYCDHGHAVWRKYQIVQITCQADGTLLSVAKDNGYTEGTSFEPEFASIPKDYRVSVQTTFESGDANTAAYISVHQQIPHGAQIFVARANGTWFIYRVNTQGHTDGTLDQGTFAPPAKTLTLQVEVHGSNMVYTINGQSVSSITDTTYLTSVDLSFGIFDYKGTTPYSALFTHFVYTPLA